MHPSRRSVLRAGLAALATGLAAPRSLARLLPAPNDPSILLDAAGGPIARVKPSTSMTIGGLPFHPSWLGDHFDQRVMPFHHGELPLGAFPVPDEEVDVAIVGGGLSGLAAAYTLRKHKPVILELHSRFGGTSQGERWNNLDLSLGGAYFITPDEGSELEQLYRELGLESRVRVSPPTDDPAVINRRIVENFWDGLGLPADQRAAFEQYRKLVLHYGDEYPDIPLDPAADNQWIRDLDNLTLKAHLEQSLTVPAPPRLEAALQAYCTSSFNAGWDDISAASGWNFIAAEEFGRWILPGGNAGLVQALWQRLYQSVPSPGRPRLRVNARVVDVRVLARNRVQVTYSTSTGVFRSLIAKRVVLACPKHICRYILPDLEALDFDRSAAMHRIHTSGYIVANVLLRRRVALDWYDAFMLGDGTPIADVNTQHRVTDVVNGHYAQPTGTTDALTLYWPLPFAAGRFQILPDDGLRNMAERLAASGEGGIDPALEVLGLTRADILQIRMARWGHAMPIAAPGLIASGVCEKLREPFMDHIFFVNQDNWALPAVETCLLEAIAMKPLIAAGL